VVIFGQPFLTTTMTTSFSSLSIGQKQGRQTKEKRENKNIMWVWKRELSRSCHKMVVHISFL